MYKTILIAGVYTAVMLSMSLNPVNTVNSIPTDNQDGYGVKMMNESVNDNTAPEMPKQPRLSSDDYKSYLETIQKTADMVSNSNAQTLAQKFGLNILNVTWEDTGRYKGSSVGPNISDMTIQVSTVDPKTEQVSTTCMPVIRFPNFSDKSCDLDPFDFTLLVGNQKGRELKKISLYEFLANPTNFLSNPDSWKAKTKTLLADRDTKVLVSAQACFLPIPQSGKATFNPVLFNYQSRQGDPAVLTILVTREGTSVTIIDNKRDAFQAGWNWGQRLFHNQNGQRASLTGERMSDYVAQGGTNINGGPVVGETESGLNMVLLIQVPLKQKRPLNQDENIVYCMSAPSDSGAKMAEAPRSDVENAVIGHGDLEGPFTEIDNLEIERDDRYPIRVTVQFYKATSNGVVSEQDMAEIKAQIDRVYEKSSYVGSLVTEGETGRVTEYYGAKVQPPNWWELFWKRYEQNTGVTREEAVRRIRELLGRDYMNSLVTELYLRNLLDEKK